MSGTPADVKIGEIHCGDSAKPTTRIALPARRARVNMLAVPAKEYHTMGKTSVATRIAAAALAAELGVKPSRTVKALQSLTMPSDFAPRKGSEGRRPTPETKDWETPFATGSSSWGYVVQGAPKRVISLPDDRPAYWAALQGEVLLGHVRNSFACCVGEAFEYVGGRVSRVSPAQVVMRYLQRFRVVDIRVQVQLAGADAVKVAYLDYDPVARDADPVEYTLAGSARHILERLRWVSVNDQCQLDDDE